MHSYSFSKCILCSSIYFLRVMYTLFIHRTDKFIYIVDIRVKLIFLFSGVAICCKHDNECQLPYCASGNSHCHSNGQCYCDCMTNADCPTCHGQGERHCHDTGKCYCELPVECYGPTDYNTCANVTECNAECLPDHGHYHCECPDVSLYLV